MAKLQYGIAPTSVKLRVKLMDSSKTDGSGLTGLTSASSGLIISTIQNIQGANGEASATIYTQAASNIETIATLGTYAAPTTNKCRFKEIDATNHPGVYEIQIADARYSATGDATKAMTLVVSVLGATNLAQCDIEIECKNQDVNVIQAAGVAWASGAMTDAVFAAATYPKAIRTGTAQASATGYIRLDASASATDDLYTGNSVKIVSGTGAGQARTILLYVGATQRAYVDRVWVTTPSTDSVFIINSGKITLDIVNVGVATAGGASTITLATSAVATNEYYDGGIVQIISGTGVCQSRVITSYVGSTRVATVSDEWAVQPDNTSVYAVRGLGDIEVGVNNDKTGYALSSTQTFNVTGNITGNLTGSVGSVTGNVGGSVASVTAGVTVATNGDKTGYALTNNEHTNIASDSATGILITPANKLYTDVSGYVKASVTGTMDANIVSINGALTTGNNATLNLKQLSIVNNAGTAVVMTSIGGDGDGLQIRGNGIGNGASIRSGSGATGNGMVISALSTDGSGVYCEGSGAQAGLKLVPGAHGNGLDAVGGSIDGSAIHAFAASGDAVQFESGYSGANGLFIYGPGVGINAGGDVAIKALGNVKGLWALGSDYGIQATEIQAIQAKTDQLTFTVANKVDASATVLGTADANIVSIDGQATNGHNATLNLKQLSVVNNAGTAVVFTSIGSNGDGLQIRGNGIGNGASICSGSGATGNGMVISALSTDGSGVYCGGSGAQAGLKLVPGAHGNGFDCVGGSVDGSAIRAYATKGDAVQFESAYSGGNGLYLFGYNGVGISANGDIAIKALGNVKGILAIGGSCGIQATEIQAIQAKTDQLTFTTPTKVDATATVVGTADVNVIKINGSTDAASKLSASAPTMATGTVDASVFTPTASLFDTSLTTIDTSHWNDRWVIFTSGQLTGQAKPITGYQLVSGRGRIQTSGFSLIPANSDAFIIV